MRIKSFLTWLADTYEAVVMVFLGLVFTACVIGCCWSALRGLSSSLP